MSDNSNGAVAVSNHHIFAFILFVGILLFALAARMTSCVPSVIAVGIGVAFDAFRINI